MLVFKEFSCFSNECSYECKWRVGGLKNKFRCIEGHAVLKGIQWGIIVHMVFDNVFRRRLTKRWTHARASIEAVVCAVVDLTALPRKVRPAVTPPVSFLIGQAAASVLAGWAAQFSFNKNEAHTAYCAAVSGSQSHQISALLLMSDNGRCGGRSGWAGMIVGNIQGVADSTDTHTKWIIWRWISAFFRADILTFHNRKSSGVTNKTRDGSVQITHLKRWPCDSEPVWKIPSFWN